MRACVRACVQAGKPFYVHRQVWEQASLPLEHSSAYQLYLAATTATATAAAAQREAVSTSSLEPPPSPSHRDASSEGSSARDLMDGGYGRPTPPYVPPDEPTGVNISPDALSIDDVSLIRCVCGWNCLCVGATTGKLKEEKPTECNGCTLWGSLAHKQPALGGLS